MHRATVVWRSLDRSVIDVLGQVLQVPIDPAFGKRLVSSTDDLHVLLRHRLRSISLARANQRLLLSPESETSAFRAKQKFGLFWRPSDFERWTVLFSLRSASAREAAGSRPA